MASKFTKKNPKLGNEMMVAAMMPCLLMALRRVDKGTVSFEYPGINRVQRSHFDKCVCLEVPVRIEVGTSTGWRNINLSVRFYLRDDSQQFLEWDFDLAEVSGPAIRKAEVEFRRRLRRSAEPKIRELAGRWKYGGCLVDVDFSTDEFGELVRAITATD